jgi:PAT family acetyl-CoA transporter-like MFS transporter 1
MIANTTLRGRTLEDLGELEEKGLLRRTSSREVPDVSARRRDKGKEKEKVDGWLEVRRDGEEDKGEGLTSTRDKQAFALLVLLCERAFRHGSIAS